MSIEADINELYNKADDLETRIEAVEDFISRAQGERPAVTGLEKAAESKILEGYHDPGWAVRGGGVERAAEVTMERQRILEEGVTLMMIWRPEATTGVTGIGTRFDGIEVYLQTSEAAAEAKVEELHGQFPRWRFLVTTAKWWGEQ